MKKAQPVSIIQVPLKQIDASDNTYRITPPGLFPLGDLGVSVSRVGILVPLRLEEKERGYFRIVTGFRRYEAGRRCGLERFPALAVSTTDRPENALSLLPAPPTPSPSPFPGSSGKNAPSLSAGRNALSLFTESIYEKRGERELKELEKGIVVSKLRNRFGVDSEEIIQQYLPILGVKPSRRSYERYRRMGELSPDLFEAVCHAGLLENTALRLADWQQKERRPVVETIGRCRLGTNKQKRLVDLIEQLKSSTGLNVLDLWKKSGIADLIDDSTVKSSEHYAQIIDRLRRLRYPTLSAYEEKFRQLSSSLNLPEPIRLSVPQYFEGNRVTLTIRAENPHEVEELGKKLIELSRSRELKAIFELL